MFIKTKSEMENGTQTPHKVSVGCRLLIEQKNALLIEAKEKGYNSFSQYLEFLISEHLDGKKSAQNINSLDFEKLTEDDLNNIEARISNLLESREPKTSNLPIEPQGETLDEFLDRLAIVCGVDATDETNISNWKETLKADFTNDEILTLLNAEESVFQKLIEEHGDFTKFPVVELSEENKSLLNDFLTYLVEHSTAVSMEGALIGSIYNLLENSGGMFGTDFPGRKEFLKPFAKADKVILENNGKEVQDE